MNVALWPLWLRLIAVGAVLFMFLVGMALMLSGLFGDRARGRVRCPRCWFDMSRSPTRTCGECGSTARRDRDLRRTRRRPVRTIAGLIIAVGAGVLVSDEMLRGRWPSFLPTSALLTMLPFAGDQHPYVVREISARLARGTIDSDEAQRLLDRLAKGTWIAAPPSESWARHSGPVAELFIAHMIAGDDERARKAAERIQYDIARAAPPTVRLQPGRSVPPDMGAIGIAEVSEWWTESGDLGVEIQPRLPGASPHRMRRGARLQRTHGFMISLPLLPPGEHEIEFDVRTRRRFSADEVWEPWSHEVITERFHVADPNQALPSREDREMDEVIGRVFAGGLSYFPESVLPVRIAIDRRPTFIELFDGVAIGVEVDIRRDEVVVRRLISWWLGGHVAAARRILWEVPWFDESGLAPSPRDDEVWTVVVRGRPDLAAQVEGATSIWAGEVEVVVPIRSSGRSAPWTVWLPWEE